MTDHDAFITGIVAHPADDLPRLLYADWLDEHGDPRGRFIRLQLDLTKLPPSDPRRESLNAEAVDLLNRHGATWIGPVAKWLRDYSFWRGFVEWVEVELITLNNQAYTILELPVVRRLSCIPELPAYREMSPLHHLAQCPGLARIEQIDFANRPLEDFQYTEIFESPFLTGLRVLNLRNAGMSFAQLRILAANPSLTNLERLDLRGNDVGPAGIGALDSLVSERLTEITVHPEDLGDNGLEALDGWRLNAITELVPRETA